MYEEMQACAEVIKDRIGARRPQIAIVLGSGLNQLANILEDPIRIAYSELPGFTAPTVEGHSGTLHVGMLAGKMTCCLQGRVHGYEGVAEDRLGYPTRVMAALGVKTMLLTNATGSLMPEAGPGNLMLITDHINMMGLNPLVGINDERLGLRFPDMTNAWNPELNAKMRSAANALSIPLYEGVYVGVRGPNFETPAEIRMMQMLGGAAVGMSTIPEVLAARHAGMTVVGVSSLTNFAAGITGEVINHEEVMEVGLEAGETLAKLITAFVKSL